jgi:hypothetical protein
MTGVLAMVKYPSNYETLIIFTATRTLLRLVPAPRVFVDLLGTAAAPERLGPVLLLFGLVARPSTDEVFDSALGLVSKIW